MFCFPTLKKKRWQSACVFSSLAPECGNEWLMMVLGSAAQLQPSSVQRDKMCLINRSKCFNFTAG